MGYNATRGERAFRNVRNHRLCRRPALPGTPAQGSQEARRGPTAAQRVALLWSKPKCANVACSATIVQIDHRIPWADTHHTRLDQLDPLCPHHHKLKTNQDWALEPGTGRRAFVAPKTHDTPATNRRPTPVDGARSVARRQGDVQPALGARVGCEPCWRERRSWPKQASAPPMMSDSRPRIAPMLLLPVNARPPGALEIATAAGPRWRGRRVRGCRRGRRGSAPPTETGTVVEAEVGVELVERRRWWESWRSRSTWMQRSAASRWKSSSAAKSWSGVRSSWSVAAAASTSCVGGVSSW